MAFSIQDLIKKVKAEVDNSPAIQKTVKQIPTMIAPTAIRSAVQLANLPRPDVTRFTPQYNQARNFINNPPPQVAQWAASTAPKLQNFTRKLVNTPVIGTPAQIVGNPRSPVQRFSGELAKGLASSVGSAGKSFDKNFSMIAQGEPLQQRLPTVGLGAWNTAKAISQVTPQFNAASAVPALLGGGIALAQGKDPYAGAGKGFSEYQGWKPVLGATNPAISGLSNRLAGANSFAVSQGIQRGVHGVGNVVEDEILARFNQLPVSNKDRIFSLIIGAGMAGNSDALKVLAKNDSIASIAKTLRLTPQEVAQKAVELNQKTQARKLTYKNPTTNKIETKIVDKDGLADWIAHLESEGLVGGKDYNWEFTNSSIGAVGKVNPAPNQPGKLVGVNRLDNQVHQVDNSANSSQLTKQSLQESTISQKRLSSLGAEGIASEQPKMEQKKLQMQPKEQVLQKPQALDLESQSQPYFNTKNLNVSKKAKKQIDTVVEEIKPQIEKATGKKLTNKEVIEKANQSAKVLDGTVGKDQTLAWESALLKARQKLAALSERGVVDQEYIDALMTVKTYGTDIARKLQSFGIGADAELVTSKQAILEAVLKATDDADTVLQASKGVDFNDLQQATTFYRRFVKPRRSEWIDLIRYNSMLSSPNTHINNAFSNAQGTGLIAPIEKTVEGSLDAMRSAITGKPRTIFAGEGARFAKGYYSNISTAAKRFTDVMRGKQQIKNPDMRHIRLAPVGKAAKVESVLNYPMRLLEAADQFFSAMTEGGTKQALEYRAGKMGKPIADLESVAQKEAAERLFRSELGDNQGSYALDALDTVANSVQRLKDNQNPIVSTVAKFTLPFLRTPTNLLKQGVEFSPVGIVSLPGAKNKQQLIARSIIGSSIALGTGMLLGSDRLTWAEPTGDKQRNAFRAAGLQPYSVKIGNNWVSYSKLHPAVSFNIALVAALKDSHDKGDIDDTQLDTILGGLAKWMNFYADQSYMKNIGDIVSATKGDIYGLSKMVSNYPQQLIPFRALMGWINRIIEPYQRQVNPDVGMLEKQFQYMATQIPGLSGIVPLRMSPDGQPIENQNRLLNAVSPLRVTTQVKDYARPTKGVSNATATGSIPTSIPTDQNTFNELYKKALSNGTDFPTQKALIEADPTLDDAKKAEKIEKLRTETAQWAETLVTMQDKYPKQVFGAELKTYGKSSSFTVEDRSGWVEKQLNKVTDENDLQEKINQMWESGVLTTGSNGTAEYLKDELGLDLYIYTGTDKKVKDKVSKGKGGKKVSLGQPTEKKTVKLTPTRSSMAKIPFNISAPKTTRVQFTKTKKPSTNLLQARQKLQSLTKLPASAIV